MKKIIASLVAVALASSVAFADVKLSFYNKLYEDSSILDHYDNGKDDDGDSETVTDFPGINERMFVEVLSDRVDAMVKATMTLDDYDEQHFGIQGKVNDWYIEFRPIEMITLGMHTAINPDGSYLPVYDDNLGAGNIGSDGFTVTFKPIENLRIGVTTPFSFDGSDKAKDVNWLDGKAERGEDEEFNTGIGAIFDHEKFQIGASIQDILDSDERQVGAYINMPGLFGVYEPLTIGAGFAHSECYQRTFSDLISVGHLEAGIGYENLLNAYATVEFEKFSLSAEMLYNLGGDDEWVKAMGFNPLTYDGDDGIYGYDFYTGASISFGLVDKLTATATGRLLMDMTSSSKGGFKNMLFGSFAINYDLNDRNTLGAEFDVATRDKDWAIAIPVYWKYHFEN